MMIDARLRVLLALCFSALLLTGCSNSSGYADIDAFMAEVKARRVAPPEALPEFQAYEAFAYVAAGKRSPFQPPLPPRPPRPEGESGNIAPNFDRPTEELENFNIAELRMVGTLESGGTMFALVRDRNGVVHRVSRGNYMGTDHGEVLSVSETTIELDEIVPDGLGGWIQRSRTVQIASSD